MIGLAETGWGKHSTQQAMHTTSGDVIQRAWNGEIASSILAILPRRQAVGMGNIRKVSGLTAVRSIGSTNNVKAGLNTCFGHNRKWF